LQTFNLFSISPKKGGCVKEIRRILLYGNSVILGAIGASLRRCSQFEVTTLSSPLEEVREFDAVNPDILLFDLETPHTEAVFSMLETNPNLLLIGISPDINLVKIWSGRQLKDISTEGFLDLIKNEIKGLSVDARSD
jgi:WD40 repeat protein